MFQADWHQDDRANPLVRQYQTALDSVLQSHPKLQGCAVCCIQCGIRFLTHPRNAGRRNLRCPFGCRRHHRQQRSNQRSTAYNRTSDGKRNKKAHNNRRYGNTRSDCQQQDISQQTAADTPANEPETNELPVTVELRLEGVVLNESSLATSPMLPYVRMIVSLIEGVKLCCDDVVRLLRQAMRQRSIGDRRRIDYLLGFLHQHPP